MNIPETQVIEVPEQYVLDDFQTSFIASVRSWDDVDQTIFQTNKKSALDMFLGDPTFFGVPTIKIQDEFEILIREEIEHAQRGAEQSIYLKRYMDQHTGERIYVFPKISKVVAQGVSEEQQRVYDSALAHELFHLEQGRRGLNTKFLNIVEGPAWVLQFLYGADHLGLERYLALCSSMAVTAKETGQGISQREERKSRRVDIGMEVVSSRLGIRLNGDIAPELAKFKYIFAMPGYAYMDVDVLYRYTKPILEERLK